MSRPPIPSTSSFPYKLGPEDYSHSPIHHAVVLRDHATLTKLVSTLPRLEDPLKINTEAESLSQEKLAEQISSFIDRRDVPLRETPLHLAVKLNDLSAVETLTSAGADPSLHNSAGWNPLQEALTSGRNHAIVLALARHHHRCSWSKFRRRLPRFVSALRRMRDFYMEISFHFESSVIPFVKSLLPSDTYKIWKREGNLRADMSLAGFDGLKLQRANQSILFLGEGDDFNNIPWGSLLVLNRDKRKIFDAFENTGPELSETEARDYVGQSSVGRPGMDVTKAELVGRTNWRWQEKTETVGEWKAKVYEVHNVIFSFRSRKVVKNNKNDSVLPIELDFDEDEDGFLVAENPNFGISDKRRHSSFVKEDIGRGDIVTVGRKSVDIIPSASSSGLTASNSRSSRRKAPAVVASNGNSDLGGSATKEKEFVRSLRPAIWLTEQFPLKTEELLPLLDILANKVKAVRRMRELLTTKFPPGTFPVKFAIPVVPTVRVVITFTKFVDLQPTEQFYTPFSSPLHFSQCGKGLAGILEEEDNQEFETHNSSSSSSTSKSTSRPRRSMSRSSSKQQQRHCREEQPEEESDPFAIPSGYTWRSRKSKATRKS